MPVILLIDPSIALVTSTGGLSEVAASWQAFVDWQLDDRARLGVKTYALLSKFYTRLAAGEQIVPAPLKQSVHRSVATMLARGPIGAIAPSSGVLQASYFGHDEHEATIKEDLAGAADIPNLVLGSIPENWPVDTEVTGLVPPPPSDIPIHFRPNLPTEAERREEFRLAFAGVSIIVIGGQSEPRVVERLERVLGIPVQNIRWIPSELHKQPRNLDAVTRGASLSQSVVICITGAVGHATSGTLESQCSRRRVTYIEVESANGIAPAIIARLHP